MPAVAAYTLHNFHLCTCMLAKGQVILLWPVIAQRLLHITDILSCAVAEATDTGPPGWRYGPFL